MPRIVKFSLSLFLLVALTVPVKILYTSLPANPDEQRLANAMGAMLQSQGFTISFGEMVGIPTIIANKGDCNLLVTRVKGAGYSRSRLRLASADYGKVEFYYLGQLTKKFPRLRPVIDEHLQIWLTPFGWNQQIHPVIAIASDTICRKEALDWSSFRLFLEN